MRHANERSILSCLSCVPAAALLLAFALPVHATTLHVANNGDDTFFPPCGPKTTPCRSISKAISLAAAGDTIIVGPGVYGDLDGDGTFEPAQGEEAAEVGSGCNCMIKVDKLLTIKSRDGARVTVLDAGGLPDSVVQIVAPAADGSAFGKPSKGFTLRNGATNGLLTDASAQKVKVAGNIATGNVMGFVISGNGGGANSVTVTDNIAVANFVGFNLSGSSNVMNRNRAVRNVGGFVVLGMGHTVNQNVATFNLAAGFSIDLSTGNEHPLASFSKNAGIGNRQEGVAINAMSAAMGANVTIAKSNLFGNGDGLSNCGLRIDNGDATHQIKVHASGNYWGASTGPGSNPADDAGGGSCSTDAGGGIMLDTSSPAAKAFGVAEKALK